MSTSEIFTANNNKLTNKLIPSRDLPIYAKSLTNPENEVFNQPIKTMADKHTIKLTNGKYLINGKPIDKCTDEEKEFFSGFIIAMRLDYGKVKHDEKLKTQKEWIATKK